LIGYGIKTEGRAAVPLRDRDPRNGLPVPLEPIVNVVDLIGIGESARGSGGVIFVEEICFDRRVAIACEREIDLPVLAGGVSDINPEVVGDAGLQALRIESEILFGVILGAVIG
jgi:hypothetical protein